MGLPNGGVSLAKRLIVCTWNEEHSLSAQLDVDNIVTGKQRTIHKPASHNRPKEAERFQSGTTVRLTKCDRISYKRAGNLGNRLRSDFGRIYRHYINNGLVIEVNNESVEAIDPLLVDGIVPEPGACLFGDELQYEIEGSNGRVGRVSVRFSELPVDRWAAWSDSDKRRFGVLAYPSFSILRGKREIDRGWFFMGSKRRENYDRWWRCEVSFDPSLDEFFGITHAKQKVSPTREIEAILAPDIEAIGRALNQRIRKAFRNLKYRDSLIDAQKKADRVHESLQPLSHSINSSRSHQRATERALDGPSPIHRIVIAPLDSTAAYDYSVDDDGRLCLLMNEQHPLFRDLYEPLAKQSGDERSKATLVALTLLAAARAEALIAQSSTSSERPLFRQVWSDITATFFNA